MTPYNQLEKMLLEGMEDPRRFSRADFEAGLRELEAIRRSVTSAEPRLVNEYVWVNDGEWYSISAEERAILEAKVKAYDAGYAHWQKMILEELPCDNREPNAPGTHYPNSCYHYRVTLEGCS